MPKSKPRALNAALPFCRGEIVGVFDAEDDVDPRLIERVDQCFQESGADVVQAGVQLVNIRSSWFAVRNALEYYFWFRSRLHFHAHAGFIPLGGNTVFVRTTLLRAVDGWDDECLAEDCELGVRLSSLGAKTVVFYEPELATREETPANLGAFVRQRTRWSQGYLQTLSKNYWRELPLRRRALGLYTLAMPYVMAVVWVLLPLAIVTALLLRVPVVVSLISFLPAIPMLAVLGIELAGLGEMCRSFDLKARLRDYVRLVVSLPFYQCVLSFASSRAVLREARGVRGWEKTAHFGLHLDRDAEEHEPSTVVAATSDASPDHTWIVYRGWSTEGRDWSGSTRTMTALTSPEFDLARNRDRNDIRLDDAPAPSPPATSGATATARKLAGAIPLLVFFAFVAWVQGTNFEHWPATFFDEGTYISNAWAVQHGALSNYTYGYGHPPLAWLMVSLWTWATNGLFGPALYSVTVGRELIVAVSVATCVLLYILCRRLGIGRIFAVGGVALFAFSPLSLYFHRLVLIDNPGVMFALGAFVLALSPRQRLWVFAASGACFAASVLSKESMLVLLPALVLAALQNSDRRNRRYCWMLLGSFFVLVLAIYPLYATLKGELFPGPGHVSMLGELHTQLFTRQATGSVFDPRSQTYGIVRYWFHLDPWLLPVALVLAPVALFSRVTRVAAVALLVQAVMVLRPGYLPFMYVIGLLPFAAIVVAGIAQLLWRAFASRSSRRPQGPPVRIAAAVVLVVLLGVFTVGAAPGWAGADRAAMTLRLDGPELGAKQWLLAHVSHRDRVLVADDFWVFLIEHGFDDHAVDGGFFSRTVVFYWPFDFDPAVRRKFPQGWKQLDYIVSTQGMRNDRAQVPRTAAALDHSRLVATFGHGATRIEIRRIEHGPRAPSN
jgi:hypothetical protein